MLAVLGMLLWMQTASTAQHARFEYWRTEEGLPQNSITKIIQDRQGYLWLASEGGAIQFDGVKFNVYSISRYPQLESNRISSLLAGTDGSVFIGTNKGGLSVFKDNTITNISNRIGIRSSTVAPLAIDSRNRLWSSSTEAGTIVIDATTYHRIHMFDTMRHVALTAVHELGDDDYVLIALGIPMRWAGGRYHGPESDALRNYPRRILASMYDPASRSLWLVADRHLYRMRDHRKVDSILLPTDAKPLAYAHTIYDTSPGILTLTMRYKGLTYLNTFDTTSRRFTQPAVLQTGVDNGGIKCVFVDNEKNVWYASRLSGLIKQKPSLFEYVDYDTDLKSHNIYAITRDSRNRTILGTNGHGMYIMDSAATINYCQAQKGSFHDDFILSVTEGEPGALYVSSFRDYIYRISARGTEYLPVSGSTINSVKAIYRSKSGRMYAGGIRCIHVLNGKHVGTIPVADLGESDIINTFFEDSTGTMWLVSDNHIIAWKDGRFVNHHVAEKLHVRFFRGAACDTRGTMYFGTYGHGLVVYDGKKFVNITTNHGLKEDVVSTITEDRYGNLWLTGNKGLSRVRRSDVQAFLDGTKRHVNAMIYDQRDGLISSEFNGGFQQAKYKVSDDVYLYPSLGGCVKVDFRKILQYTIPPPPVYIEQVHYQDSTYLLRNDTLTVPYSAGRIEFLYTALSFVSPKNVMFRYRLEGYDTGWINAGSERKTSYTDLPPGTYVLRVQAASTEGIWSTPGADLTVVIAPPFYMTLAFTAFAALFSAVLVGGILYTFIRVTRTKEANRLAIMSVSPDLMLRMNRSGKYIDVLGNEKELVLPFNEIKGKYPKDVLPAELAELIDHYHRIALDTGEVQVFEYLLTHHDGRVVTYEGRMVAVGRSEVLYIIRDVTDRKKAEQELKDYQVELVQLLEQKNELIAENRRRQLDRLNTIVETQEMERTRIANDLHDGIAQMLSIVKINISALEHGLASPEKVNETIRVTQRLVDSIAADLKNVSYNLMPSSLSNFGLIPALEELTERIHLNAGMAFKFVRHTQHLGFDPRIDVNIYRIVQELVNNTLKHASATEMLLQIIEHDDFISVTFENNGLAFDPHSGQNKHESRGLKNIVSRVKALDGSIHFYTDKNGEITITLDFPLHSERRTS